MSISGFDWDALPGVWNAAINNISIERRSDRVVLDVSATDTDDVDVTFLDHTSF